jgi:hypothetical protein
MQYRHYCCHDLLVSIHEDGSCRITVLRELDVSCRKRMVAAGKIMAGASQPMWLAHHYHRSDVTCQMSAPCLPLHMLSSTTFVMMFLEVMMRETSFINMSDFFRASLAKALSQVACFAEIP